MFKNSDILSRVIRPYPNYFRSDGSISSAVFKDSKGVSVDYITDRLDQEVKETFLKRFPDSYGEARVSVQSCINRNCKVKPDPTDSNPYHSLILGNNKPQLTSGQAKYLSSNSNVIIY